MLKVDYIYMKNMIRTVQYMMDLISIWTHYPRYSFMTVGRKLFLPTIKIRNIEKCFAVNRLTKFSQDPILTGDLK